MKKTLLLAILIFPILMNGQNILDTINTLSNNEKMSTYVIGNNNDTIGKNVWEYVQNQVEWVYMSYTNGEWQMQNRSQRSYDEKGNILSNLYMEFKNNQWENRFLDLYSYDEIGNKTEHLLLEYKRRKWTTIQGERITLTYEDNLIKEIVSESYEKEVWVKNWKTEYLYSDKTLLTSFDYLFENENWTAIYRSDYDWYSWQGKPSSSLIRSLKTYENINGTWISTTRPHSKRNNTLISYN